MDRKIIKRTKMLCPCCMEEHEVQMVEILTQNVFKDTLIQYPSVFFYCTATEEYYSDEALIRSNDISMKNAYRRKLGLLTSNEISSIRTKYEISQSDLCRLLGWGQKTITRYEGHQVQDAAHDTILRKLAEDPEWFLVLLEAAKDDLPDKSYLKYRSAAISLFEYEQDSYLRKSILARYMRYYETSAYNGNRKLSLDVVIDVIRYFSNTAAMKNLHKVKLMDLLWYSDVLSYKERGHAITGLVYQARSTGAVPIAHDLIIELHGIECEEIDMGEYSGYCFHETDNKEYHFLSNEDLRILDRIVRIFGKSNKNAIMDTMHQEPAYAKTALQSLISFQYAETLSIN